MVEDIVVVEERGWGRGLGDELGGCVKFRKLFKSNFKSNCRGLRGKDEELELEWREFVVCIVVVFVDVFVEWLGWRNNGDEVIDDVVDEEGDEGDEDEEE